MPHHAARSRLTSVVDGSPLSTDKPLGLAVAEASGLLGLEPFSIRVEVCSSRGPAFFQMVGLPEAAVRESRVRVASALAGLSVLLDEYAITVNLAPADVKKSGAALDLAIAVGILAAIGRIPSEPLAGVLLLGELSLDGSLKPCRGVLPQLRGGLSRGLKQAIVAHDNRAEASLVSGLRALSARSLQQVVEHFSGRGQLGSVKRTPFRPQLDVEHAPDLADVRGQAVAKRALEIAAAGGHHLLFVGPPGTGKTLLARALPGILPPLTFDEALEITALYSVAGQIESDVGMVVSRPFRAPHHSVSEAGLVGGGSVPRPGELSLAHRGILFLDELPEFRRSALEALRQPLESGVVSLSRARYQARFPARPTVVAAMNPCPCGYLGHPRRSCRCSASELGRYRRRLSGPLLDRLDVQVAVPPVDVVALTRGGEGEASKVVRERVMAAKVLQRERHAQGITSALDNANLQQRDFARIAQLDRDGARWVERAVTRLGMSARGFAKVLRVARTIADLEGEQKIRAPHVAEAIQGRWLDRET